MEWVSKVAEEYGLFVALVVFVLWDSRNRELRYLSIIDKLSDSVEGLQKDMADIKAKILKR